jgi:sugar-specific transcriptional regulator TrmB
MDADDAFERLGLTEYEETALRELFRLGRTTAPDLAEAAGIPKARVYGVLDELADRGFLKVVPGRPKEYVVRSPSTVLDRARENRRQAFESFAADLEAAREPFTEAFGPEFERADADVTPAEELFHVVDLGDPSERETRRIYHEADDRVRVLTKGFDYFDRVEGELSAALQRGVEVRVLFLSPDHPEFSAEKRQRLADVLERIDEDYPAVDYRFSETAMPWRGTFADPTMAYDGGEAILVVQADEVPNHRRQAAITDNGAFVAGLNRYFELVWRHDSAAEP